MMMTCPHCGAQLRPGARFCYLCGSPVNAPSFGVCTKGHSQARLNARFCYVCGAPVNPVPVAPSPVTPVALPPVVSGPTFNGRYQVIGELGRGGMGSIVYKVQDLQTPGWVLALKEMDETKLESKLTCEEKEEIIKAFQREADLLQRLDHPNIVKVYEYFQIGAKHYMAMDLVSGRTLQEMLDASPGGFPDTRALPWVEQLCDAMGYLHGLTPPIIYRDMKPGNVMVEDATGQIKMIDFGIAREHKGGHKKSDTVRLGTAGYAAPEAYGTAGSETGPASDVYSLGAMSYQLLTGGDPTNDPLTFFDKAKLVRPPVSVSSHVADAIERAVEKDRDKRFQSMSEFKAALTGQPASAPMPKPRSRKKSAGPAPPYSPPIPVPSRSLAPLQVSAAQLDLGRVEKGGLPPSPQSFTVTLSGGGTAQVRTSEGWLVATPSSVGNGQSVEVSVRTELLTLGNRSWAAPNIFVALIAVTALLLSKAWLIVAAALFVGIWWRWIWQGAALILGGALGLQLAMWLVSWLLPRVVAFKADHAGEVKVTAGATQTIHVQVTAAPSVWRRVIGWSTLILVVATEVVIAAAALWWLVEGLGRWWR